MFKRLLVSLAVAASASFATWDKFPVLEEHKGEALVGMGYSMYNRSSSLSGDFAVRYGVIRNLELAINVPYVFFVHEDGEDIDMDGLANVPVMGRYQFLPFMNVFADVRIPIGDESIYREKLWKVDAGLQFSSMFGDAVSLGSEVGVSYESENWWEVSPLELMLGVELDYRFLPQFKLKAGVDFYVSLGEIYKGDYEPSHGGGTKRAVIYGGAEYKITENFGVSIDAGVGVGKDYYLGHTPLFFGGKFYINF